MAIKIKIYGLFPVNKKQFHIIYGLLSAVFLSLTVLFIFIEIPVEESQGEFSKILTQHFYFVWLLCLLGTIIEGQFYWNKFTKAQLKLIDEQKEEISAQAEELLARNEEIQLQNSIIEAKNRNITDSINYAKKIQKAVFQISEADKNIEQTFSFYLKPRDIVSGDFYWIKKVGKKSIFVAADCTGHGVPGAFMSLLGISFLNQILQDFTTRKKEVLQKDHAKIGIYYEYVESEDELTIGPAQFLNELREKIKQALHQSGYNVESKDGMDLAMAILDNETYVLKYAGAHTPLVYQKNSNIEVIKGDRMPVGIHLKEKPFTEHTLNFEKGNCFYLFSDGVIDQFGTEKDEKFKMKRLLSVLEGNKNEKIEKQVKNVGSEFEKWKGANDQLDDVLFLGVEV